VSSKPKLYNLPHPERTLLYQTIARIYEVFPLPYPNCGGQMRLIAFITKGAQISKIWRQNPLQITRQTRASIGDPAQAAISTAAGSRCLRARPKSILQSKVSPMSGCEGSNCLGQTCFEAPNGCHTWPHAVEFPIRVESDNIAAAARRTRITHAQRLTNPCSASFMSSSAQQGNCNHNALSKSYGVTPNEQNRVPF
jgi:hypothetical protein